MKKRDSTICVAKTSGKIDQPVYCPGWTDLWTDIVSCPSGVFNINITIKKEKENPGVLWMELQERMFFSYSAWFTSMVNSNVHVGMGSYSSHTIPGYASN